MIQIVNKKAKVRSRILRDIVADIQDEITFAEKQSQIDFFERHKRAAKALISIVRILEFKKEVYETPEP